MPNSLWPHGLQSARLPCPSPSPGVCSDPCPLSQWCHPTISSSSTLFSSCSQSYPALRSFPMSQLFTSGGQSIGVSASASVLPMDQSVSQFSHSVVPDSLWPHGLQHARPPWHHQLKPMSIESVMPSKHLILCRPLLLLPSIFPGVRLFTNESVLRIRWPRYWSFSFSISPSNEYSGLIFISTDWFDLLGF